MQTLWNAGRRLMNREIHDLLDYSRPVACTTVAATTGNLHTKGLVCRRLTDAPGNPSLSAWHYHAAQSQAEHIGALIATLLDQSPSPAEALAHALATTRTPIPLTSARRRGSPREQAAECPGPEAREGRFPGARRPVPGMDACPARHPPSTLRRSACGPDARPGAGRAAGRTSRLRHPGQQHDHHRPPG